MLPHVLSPDDFFVISDTHFGHKNILTHCNRPFGSVGEQDAVMIANWNNVVPFDGKVIHLGDFAYRGSTSYVDSIIERLNGTIYLITGNHDKKLQTKKLERLGHYHSFAVNDPDMKKQMFIVCCHYPFETWDRSHHGSISFYGHTHRELASDKGKMRFHCGVDSNNFTPVSYYDIKKKLFSREKHFSLANGCV